MLSKKFFCCLVALVAVAGCASTKVTDRKILVHGKLPRPDHILVYDFAATPADMPAESALAGHYSDHATKQTEEQIATGRRVGGELAAAVVEKIKEMGLPAQRATVSTPQHINDIVMRGYLLSVDEGSTAKRVAIGFGAGASELSVAMEGFQVTERGLRLLGSGTVDAGGSKTPGAVVPAAVAIATANPIGLVVMGGVKIYGEASGKSRIEGRADAVAQEVAKALKARFQEQGWIAK